MSWTDEEIDKLFQDSANAQSFEYDNAYFREIEAALPVTKKGNDFLWMGMAMLFIVALTSGYFMNDSSENRINGTENQLAQVELNKSETLGSNSRSETNQTEINKAEITDQTTGSELNVLDGSHKVIKTRQNGQTASLSAKNPLIELNASDKMAISVAEENARIAIGKAHRVTDEKLLAEAQVKAQDARIEIQADRAQLDTKQLPISATLKSKSVSEIDQNLDRTVLASTFPVFGQLRPKSAFYLELNSGMSQSLITPEVYSSVSYGGGIGIESYLENFNLNTGLNLKVSNYRDLELTRTWKQYNFGSTSGMDNYNYKNIYSLELPITLGYNFGQHNFNIGVRPSLLIGAKITHQSFLNEELTRSEEIYGFAGGLKRFGLKPTIGYAFHMNKWTIGANVGVQLMQSVNEADINGLNNRFPIDGKIYLRRTIRLRK